ncbi:hypothetical protein J6590_073167 [Homalodisca vitripennis]|nr:hypothetical protein J6590_073167 [Homalodisca vitripennis]
MWTEHTSAGKLSGALREWRKEKVVPSLQGIEISANFSTKICIYASKIIHGLQQTGSDGKQMRNLEPRSARSIVCNKPTPSNSRRGSDLTVDLYLIRPHYYYMELTDPYIPDLA